MMKELHFKERWLYKSLRICAYILFIKYLQLNEMKDKTNYTWSLIASYVWG